MVFHQYCDSATFTKILKGIRCSSLFWSHCLRYLFLFLDGPRRNVPLSRRSEEIWTVLFTTLAIRPRWECASVTGRNDGLVSRWWRWYPEGYHDQENREDSRVTEFLRWRRWIIVSYLCCATRINNPFHSLAVVPSSLHFLLNFQLSTRNTYHGFLLISLEASHCNDERRPESDLARENARARQSWTSPVAKVHGVYV